MEDIFAKGLQVTVVTVTILINSLSAKVANIWKLANGNQLTGFYIIATSAFNELRIV